MIALSIHNVQKITKSKIRTLINSNGDKVYNINLIIINKNYDLIIINKNYPENKNEFEITLFSNNKNNLIIGEENE